MMKIIESLRKMISFLDSFIKEIRLIPNLKMKRISNSFGICYTHIHIYNLKEYVGNQI